ncbi:cation-translocating P-type ATPase [Oligoflexus tunisiensis]|uniref:cation-translocating P-type ATPase n=1 Tax=Oligoflexus tunisiensis TaxID=708132 RepID=UPI000AE07FA6|nr:cation-translocating P-type ATPase [Oligoflexus tunisiensis]
MQKTVLDQIQPQAYQLSIDSVVTALGTHLQKGLTESEAGQRLENLGRNELQTEAGTPAWKKFLAKFKDTFVILLLFATAVSLGIWFFERGSALPYEAITIFAVVLLNAIMGYVQESRAESAVAALSQMAAPHANVIRQGERRSIPTAEVVVGDIILLEEGDTIPADARLVQSVALQTSEAALTGESLPVLKDVAPISGPRGLGDRHNMVFSGTSITYGHGRAVVVATGMQTEMGRIAGMLHSVPMESTPLQKELDRVARMLAIIVVIIALVMIATLFIFENVRGLSAIVQVLILSVALAVAAVPEGLPTIVTAVLAAGVRRMARRNAIVRRLSAVETLGSANVIASDKTGTLTRNEMTVRKVITASGRVMLSGTGYVPEGEVKEEEGRDSVRDIVQKELKRALCAADRANNAVLQEKNGGWAVQGDPTEGALVVAARKAGLDADRLEARFERIGEIPFSSERKLMSTVHSDFDQQERLMVFTKGAPDLLLARCAFELVGETKRPLSDRRRAEILETNEELAGEALRTLGVAFRALPREDFEEGKFDERVENELVFAGLIGMIDPPRQEAKAAVELALHAGIRPIMITGDHSKTASVIASELGISRNGRTMTGTELDRIQDDELIGVTRDVSVYARVNPEHKLRIVKALQKQGAIVAMTGDGVNDAPALKTADIGVAMGITGTDASKEAAAMVLADDNFASIVKAVEGGRTIFSNIQKCLRYLLSSNIGEVLTMFFGVIMAGALGLRADGSTLVLPLLATQLLWINLVTDGFPAFALGLDPADPDVMNRPPRPKGEGVITRRMWFNIIVGGAVMAVGTLAVLDASLPGGWIDGNGTMRYAQTMAFTTLMLFQMFNVFNSRSDEESAFKGLFHNPSLWAGLIVSILLQIAVVYVPVLQQAFSTVSLSGADWLRCAVVASSVLWVLELHKIFSRRQAHKAEPAPKAAPWPELRQT